MIRIATVTFHKDEALHKTKPSVSVPSVVFPPSSASLAMNFETRLSRTNNGFKGVWNRHAKDFKKVLNVIIKKVKCFEKP